MMNLVTMRFLGEPIDLNDIYHQWLGVRLDSDPHLAMDMWTRCIYSDQRVWKHPPITGWQ